MMAPGTPLATYRVQFSPGFGFGQAMIIPGYLADLGMGALYASPVWEARPDSPHGYDVTEPGMIRGALGGDEAFALLAAETRQRGLGLLLDIVPNHMAASPGNPWWHDVLEHGPSSPYSRYFDIDWDAGPGGRLVLPVLPGPLDEAIEAGRITFAYGPSGVTVGLGDERWPIEIKSYPSALASLAGGGTWKRLVHDTGLLEDWRAAGPSLATAAGRRSAALELKARWLEFLSAPVSGDRGAEAPATDPLPTDPESARSILERQPYCLLEWRSGMERINYRRFFDVADLAALRIEDPEVFEEVHRLPLQLAREGLATGLRVDHVDGLRDPAAYLHRLSERLRDPDGNAGTYLVVEKILDQRELLPEWPVDGTTGYEFLNAVNGVFVDPAGLAVLRGQYVRVTGDGRPFAEIAVAEKSSALRGLFSVECERLAGDLTRLAARPPGDPAVTLEQLRAAIVAVSAALPVYRTYIRGAEIPAADARHVRAALDGARRGGEATPAALAVLEHALLGGVRTGASQPAGPRPPGPGGDAARLDFVMRWQQLTGPAAAKGVEDTALFAYTPFVSLNEVGGDPSGRGCSVDRFHELNAGRARAWPRTMNATSTHDTKRSEDVRARLNCLSELAPEWEERVAHWMEINGPARGEVDGLPAPGPADELLFYQSLAGIWPLDDHLADGVEARVTAFMRKAGREAKKRSSWRSPSAAYEAAVSRFVREVLHGARSGEFAASFLPLQRRIAFGGAVNSLAQVVLKVASPGVPDFYQGSELWDFSLTDPDNRRPVAFDRRSVELGRLVEQLPRNRTLLCDDLLRNWRDGRVKLFTTLQSLRTRAAARAAFENGAYTPVIAEGERAANVCTFVRVLGSTWVLAAVPRLVTRLSPPDRWPLGASTWGGSRLVLPAGGPRLWGNVFTGSVVEAGAEGRAVPLASVFAEFPVALLRGI